MGHGSLPFLIVLVGVQVAQATLFHVADDDEFHLDDEVLEGKQRTATQPEIVVEAAPLPVLRSPTEKNSLVASDESTVYAIPPEMQLVPHTRLPKVPFGVLRLMLSKDIGPATEKMPAMPDNGRSQVRGWMGWYFASGFLLFLLLRRFCSNMEVQLSEEPAGSEMEVLRGRACWPTCIFILCMLLSVFTFLLTVQNCAFANEETRAKPQSMRAAADSMVLITRHYITNPGERAFLAAHSVTLSVFSACLYLWSWRKQDNVNISSSLLAQFAFRGGSLSLAVALLLESAGMMFLNETGSMEPEGANMSTALVMSVVGFSEEFAKIIAVSWGTVVLVSAVTSTTDHCCSSCLRTVVDSPRGLMLAALAAGFGFMTVENAGYVMVAAMTPPTTEVVFSSHSGDGVFDRAPRHPMMGDRNVVSEDTTDAAAITFWTCATIAIRVLLNIHPWLAGVSAARLANTVFKDGRPTACAGPGEMFDAYWPSSVIHAAYDWWVTAIAAPAALLAPPVCWYFSKRDYGEYWKEAGDCGTSSAVATM
eukprot:TRINITY_DN73320_c0_g1_i1.p1 TRINITY_DN73320_c0_g1~~TRINITY_DN73320_c0_g1_i1.p1  ORF type:complete len:535 (+),score=84.73 TRINITY_DN73320_c0_g1_i1:214-1818(+)